MKSTLLVVAAACLLTGPAYAASKRDQARSDIDAFSDPGNNMAKSYAADFGVSVGEATRRLKQQNKMRALRARLMAKYPDTFAGLYANNRGSFKVVARLVGEASDVASITALDPELAPDLVTEPAARSLKKLEGDLDAIVAQHEGAGVDFNVGVDEARNTLVLSVTDTAALDSARKAGRLKLPEYIEVREVASLVVPTVAVYGGRSYLQSDLNWCTTGFTVVQVSTGTKGSTTAGHCDDVAKYNSNLSTSINYNSSGSYLVTVRQNWKGNNMDLQWHSVSTGSYPNQFWDGVQYVTVSGTIATSVGDYVCKFGRTTARTCGTVEQYNVWVTGYGYMTKVVGSSKMNDFGDSGGPVFKGSLAAGWVHGKDAAGALYYMEAYMPESEGAGIRITKNAE